ncbi:MAG: pilus assembly protein N-terminal domain-containing protein [Maricaulaceae bacterium]
MKNNTMKSILTIATLAISTSMATPVMANDILAGPVAGPHHIIAPPQIKKTYSVGLNKTEVVRLPVAASAILVGNPNVADVSIHSANTFFVVGRSYGETNILILDTQGHTILDANVQVSNILPRNGIRVFYGGNERETYNCTPNCTAAPVLGDNPAFIAANSAGAPAINNTIALGSTASSSNSNDGDFQSGNQVDIGEQ